MGSNEICVAASALGIGSGGDGEQSEMVTPASGDEVDFSGKGRVTRVEGDTAYIRATEINGQPVMNDKAGPPEDEGAALDREMAGYAGGGAMLLWFLLLALSCAAPAFAKDLEWARRRTCSLTNAVNVVLFAAPTQVYRVEVNNFTGSTLYLMVFDSATNQLVNATNHMTSIPVPTGTKTGDEWCATGVSFDYGVNVCLSTTPNTLTNAASGGVMTIIHSGGAQ